MKRISMWFLISVAMALIVSACAPPKAAPSPSAAPGQAPAPVAAPAAPQGEWDKVLAAAKKEGTVTVYNVFGAITGKAMEEGMKKYGIKVENVGGIGNDLEMKIKTEQQAKAYVADVFMGGWVNQRNVVAQGFGQPVGAVIPSLQEKDVWLFHPGKYDPTGSAYIISTSLDAPVTINTTLVKPGEITKWDDLLNPQWKGKMVMQDPRVGSGPGTSGMAAALDLGEEFWKKMAGQNIQLVTSYDVVAQQVVYGEKAIALFGARSRIVAAIRAGATIQMLHMGGQAVVSVNGLNVVKNAPHPNAAAVLIDWIFSKEGQAAMGRTLEASSIRKDVVPTWLTIREMRPEFFTMREPPVNVDPENAKKGAEFAKLIFGAR